MALRSRIRVRQKPRWRNRVALELKNDGETVLRIDLPMSVEEDGDGLYPYIQSHSRSLEETTIDSISVSMRHRKLDG